jgi:hypothetical protein
VSSPEARRGARQRAGLMHACTSNTLYAGGDASFKITGYRKNSVDSDHGIYRDRTTTLTSSKLALAHLKVSKKLRRLTVNFQPSLPSCRQFAYPTVPFATKGKTRNGFQDSRAQDIG